MDVWSKNNLQKSITHQMLILLQSIHTIYCWMSVHFVFCLLCWWFALFHLFVTFSTETDETFNRSLARARKYRSTIFNAKKCETNFPQLNEMHRGIRSGTAFGCQQHLPHQESPFYSIVAHVAFDFVVPSWAFVRMYKPIYHCSSDGGSPRMEEMEEKNNKSNGST